jgi:hypothetical protein
MTKHVLNTLPVLDLPAGTCCIRRAAGLHDVYSAGCLSSLYVSLHVALRLPAACKLPFEFKG